MRKTLTAIILALFGFAGLSTVNADYLIGAYVDSDLEVDTPFDNAFDDDANGWMIGYGWGTSHPWLSLELTYTEFGDSNYTFTDSYSYYIYDVNETYNTSYEGEALDFWLVARFTPFYITENRPLKIVPRLGLTAASSQGTLNYTQTVSSEGEVIGSNSASASDSDSGVGYAYGLGIEIGNVIPNVDVFVDYRKHEVEMVYLGERVDFDPSSWQLGLNWHF